MTASRPSPPASIERYELGSERRSDAFATTFAARSDRGSDSSLEDRGPATSRRAFDIVLVDPHIAEVSEFRDAFLREAALLRRVTHKSLLAWSATGVENGWLYGVRRRAPDRSLGDVLHQAAGPVDLGLALRIVLDVATAVGAVHLAGKGALHGDIGPHSVFVTDDGDLVVAPTGLGVAASRSDAIAAPSANERLAYKAPEQAEPFGPKTRSIDSRADVFSLGVVLWEALAGRSLFAGGSAEDVAARVRRAQIPPLSFSLPVGLESALHKALEKDPSRRHADTGELIAALRRVPGIAKTGDVARFVRNPTSAARAAPHASSVVVAGAPALALALNPPTIEVIEHVGNGPAAARAGSGPAVDVASGPTIEVPDDAPPRRDAITVPLGRAARAAAAAVAPEPPPPDAPAKVVLNLPDKAGAAADARAALAAKARRRTETVKVARGPELEALLASTQTTASEPAAAIAPPTDDVPAGVPSSRRAFPLAAVVIGVALVIGVVALALLR